MRRWGILVMARSEALRIQLPPLTKRRRRMFRATMFPNTMLPNTMFPNTMIERNTIMVLPQRQLRFPQTTANRRRHQLSVKATFRRQPKV
jgi:hypothetical protein